jgi:hypothetical protein
MLAVFAQFFKHGVLLMAGVVAESESDCSADEDDFDDKRLGDMNKIPKAFDSTNPRRDTLRFGERFGLSSRT